MSRQTHDRSRDHAGTELATVVLLSADALPFHAGDTVQSVIAGIPAAISAHEFASLLLHEGTVPASPVTGDDSLYIDTADHLLKFVDHSGVVHPVGFTNPLTTEGDLLYEHSGAPARLAVGAANTLLHGGTDPAYSAVVEGDLALTDITTNNVSITKHGFVPKAPNVSTQFLNGLGAWATPVDVGFANPMTTQDDIILAGAAGAPGRLAKGSDGFVLTVDPTTHHVLWAAASGGMTNPMTTKGDLILGDTAGAPVRLGAGTTAYVLTSNGAGAFPSWQVASGGGGGGPNLDGGIASSTYGGTTAIDGGTP
jgi:hypothetical protein